MNTIVFYLYIRTLYGHISIYCLVKISALLPEGFERKNKVFLSFHFFVLPSYLIVDCSNNLGYCLRTFFFIFVRWEMVRERFFFLNSLWLFLLAIDWWLGFVGHVKVIFLINKVGNYFLFLFCTFCFILLFVNVID